MHRILRSYLKRLTNLSATNRSLVLMRCIKEQDFDLHELDYLNDAPSFDIIRSLIAGKKRIFLCDALNSRNEKINLLSRELRKLERREKFIFDERGSKDLYVSWPFVRGKFSDGSTVRCPLLFFPVTLFQENNKWYLKTREETIGFNKSFLQAYAYFNKVSLSDDLLDTSFEDFDSDFQVFRTQLYQLLKESPVEINFNQELFTDKLKNFSTFTRSEFDELHKDGELMLYPEAVLGIFPQAGSYLVPDYEALIENTLVADLEQFFLDRTLNEDKSGDQFRFIQKIKEEQTFTPYQIDASQENALKAVKRGNSLVIQGPPGTGKSQLICNLVADFMARGKTVLVVCQKRAALDVVYERLKEKELSDFTALVHDFKNDRKDIFLRIEKQIERLEEYKYKNSSLDTLYLERAFLQASRLIDQITEELEEFRNALFDEKECGISVKELYLTCSPDLPSVSLQQEFKHFHSDQIQAFPRKIRNWITYAKKFLKHDYVWYDRKSFAEYSISDLKRISELLDEIPYYQAEISEKLREVFDASLDLEECEWLADREEKINQILTLLDNREVYANLIHILKRQTDLDELTVREAKLMACFKEEGPETTLSSDQIVAFQTALMKANTARRHPVKWLTWKWFSKDKYLLKRVFVANKLEWNTEGFKIMMQRVDNRMNLEHNITRLKEMGWLRKVPEIKEAEVFQNWFHNQHVAIEVKNIFKELRSLKEYLDLENISFSELKSKLLRIMKVVRKVPEDKRIWLKYLNIRQVSRILSDYQYAILLKDSLIKDFDELIEFDRIQQQMLPYEHSVIKKLYDQDKDKTADSMIALFNNSIRLEWIDHIETKYPVLRIGAINKIESLEEELQNAVIEKLRISKEIVLLRTRERTYKYIDYNRLNNMVTYRDLKHQVTKKKKVWPLRKLISVFSQELFELIPCWLASPESVSAIFPIDISFDLVIFDEASQCFAEKGVPAMYRGKQVVITGDDKQLSPFDLYQARWEDETEEHADLEVDSLLDLAKKYLMEVQLKGHYRSKSLELINFSNQYFYGNNLQLLPAFDAINASENAIEYVKTEGVWENQANLIEAEEVIRLLERLIANDPEVSLGIVTFNFKQQHLISELLEDKLLAAGKQIPSNLFVKNIENVQGDERDIIIFSTGYAPDKNGRMVMNFGSLNAVNGENRLNVAVTRARKKVFVVTSILPHQLDVENARHEGPKLLKKYLEYALNISQGKRIRKDVVNNYKLDWLLKNKICDLTFDELSWQIQEELPFADLTLKDKNQYKALILTDDDMYRQNSTVKEAHAYNPISLARKNWKFKRFYSRQYWLKADEIKNSLLQLVSNVKS